MIRKEYIQYITAKEKELMNIKNMVNEFPELLDDKFDNNITKELSETFNCKFRLYFGMRDEVLWIYHNNVDFGEKFDGFNMDEEDKDYDLAYDIVKKYFNESLIDRIFFAYDREMR